jgi:hypothetical protein
MTPTGSIAHALHAGGIPWVIASQFPLWMKASSLATRTLFSGIFNGDDPRHILYKLRQRLRTDSAGTHDWASIVAYSTIPADFEQQVADFKTRQIKRKLEVKFDLADQYFQDTDLKLPDEFKAIGNLFNSIREDHKTWLEELPDSVTSAEHSHILGMRAAAEKRIGLLNKESSVRLKAFTLSLNYYNQAIKINPLNDWAITQYLSMLTVLSSQKNAKSTNALAKDYKDWWVASTQIAKWKLIEATGIDKSWAISVLAELALLGVVFSDEKINEKTTKKNVARLCQDLIDSVGEKRFPIASTQRQFSRYIKPEFCNNVCMKEIAEAALVVFDKS